MRILLKWIACVGTLFLLWRVFPSSVTVGAPLWDLLAAGSILWLVNIFIKPLAQIVSVVVTILTVGMFSFVVNAFMISLTDFMLPGLKIDSFWICLLGALILAVLNSVITAVLKEKAR
jgi:putative membrane protein